MWLSLKLSLLKDSRPFSDEKNLSTSTDTIGAEAKFASTLGLIGNLALSSVSTASPISLGARANVIAGASESRPKIGIRDTSFN